MIRLVIVAITVIGFLILSIPILFVEWIIGKFSPRTKEISSLRIIQAVFKFILWEAGTEVTICLLYTSHQEPVYPVHAVPHQAQMHLLCYRRSQLLSPAVLSENE